jgi:hypothetical protein
MASTFNVEFSVPDDPAEAEARAAEAFTDPALAVGLRPTARGAGELRYGPQVQWPFLIVIEGAEILVRQEEQVPASHGLATPV